MNLIEEFKQWKGKCKNMSLADLRAMSAGNPNEETQQEYQFPLPYGRVNFIKRFFLQRGIPKDQLYRIQDVFDCAKSPQSHVGPYANAIDFLVPDGTPVFAAREGTIIEIVDHFTRWGDDPKYRPELNYVTIDHEDGEFSQYAHLAPGSVTKLGLKVGQRIWTAGEKIGTVGKTGWTDRDHLHFIVFRRIKGAPGFQSLKINFVDHRDS